MSLLVRLARGIWNEDINGFWVFLEDDKGSTRGVYLTETTNLEEVVVAVKNEYRLDPASVVKLSYSWPQWMIGKDISKIPPTIIVSDADIQLFMAVRVEMEDLVLRVKVEAEADHNESEQDIVGGSQVFGSGKRRITMDNRYRTHVQNILPCSVLGQRVETMSVVRQGSLGDERVPAGRMNELTFGRGEGILETMGHRCSTDRVDNELFTRVTNSLSTHINENNVPVDPRPEVGGDRNRNQRGITLCRGVSSENNQVQHNISGKGKGKLQDVTNGVNVSVDGMQTQQFVFKLQMAEMGATSSVPNGLRGCEGIMELLGMGNNQVNRIYRNVSNLTCPERLPEAVLAPENPHWSGASNPDVDEIYRLWKFFGSGGLSGEGNEEVNLRNEETERIAALDLNQTTMARAMEEVVETNHGGFGGHINPTDLVLSLGNSSSQNPTYEKGSCSRDNATTVARVRIGRNLFGSLGSSVNNGRDFMEADDTSCEQSGDSIGNTCSCFGSGCSDELDILIGNPCLAQPNQNSGGVNGGGQQTLQPPETRGHFFIVVGINLGAGHVPTILYDSDAPPFFDEAPPGGEVQKAIMDVDYEGDEIFPGRQFKSKEDARIKLAIHAIHRKFHFRHARTRPHYMIVVCVSDRCPWRVYLTQVENTPRFEVRTATLTHTCSVDDRGNFYQMASTAVIGSLMRSRYLGLTRGPRPNELRTMLRLKEHGDSL